jgi:16S rRNA (adenine1518-N6/adenine1519-N6)-dimethyltransferase
MDRPAPKRPSKADQLVPPNVLLAEAKHLRAKKRFSQNFLVDADVIATIVASLNIGDTLPPIIEIGPGAGFLTQALLATGCHVTAIEVDRAMVAYLRHKLTPAIIKEQLHVIADDVLKVDLEALVADLLAKTGQKPIIVGNLPYAITSPILFRLAGELGNGDHPLRQTIQQITVMVQREVGERITAQAGCKAYNSLTVALQFWFNATLNTVVKPTSFFPAPKVQSAVITLTPLEGPRCHVNDLTGFAAMVKAVFTQRRKTLKNVFSATLYSNQGQVAPILSLPDLLAQGNVPDQARADTLSIEMLTTLGNLLYP